MRGDPQMSSEWQFGAGDLADAAAFFDRNGYVGFPDLLGDADLARLRNAYQACAADGRIPAMDHGMVVANDVILMDPVFQDLMSAPRIVEAASAMLGGVAVELQHSKVTQRTLEDSGEGALEWHQDFPFFPHSNYDLIAVLMHLDDEEVASGPIQVVPGSHRLGPRSHVGADGAFAYQITDEPLPGPGEPVLLHGPAGQITMHHCLTVHGSAPKTNRNPRRYVIPQYRAQDSVQLAGVLWECTGMQVAQRAEPRFARFPDGTRVELRGGEGRLYDRAGQLAPT